MSDAGRKMDVEDVLSSIRRLVSEEARTVTEEIIPEIQPVESVKMPKPTIELAPEMPEKLVLTPAFRVNEPPLQASIASEIEARIASIEVPTADEIPQAPMFEEPKDTVEDTPIPETPLVQEAPFEDVLQTEPSPEETTQTSDPVKSEQAAPVSEEPQQTGTIAETEDPIKAPETAVEERPVEVIKAEATEQTAAPTYGHDEIDYTAEVEPDTFLDEEALRELVSEMVRSELQGELGDRITRNVRKLVRREIHRALASRDFD